MRAAYPDADDEELLVLACSDHDFRMPSLHLAAAHTAGGGRSYLYELTWPAPASGDALGACHFLEVPLVFGVLDRGLAAQLIGTPPPPEARELSVQMQTAWTAFARRRPTRLARPQRPAPVDPGLRQRRPRRRETLPGDHLTTAVGRCGPSRARPAALDQDRTRAHSSEGGSRCSC